MKDNKQITNDGLTGGRMTKVIPAKEIIKNGLTGPSMIMVPKPPPPPPPATSDKKNTN